MGDEYPRCGAFDGGFEVLGEPAAAAKPGEGALDHPAAGKQFKPLGDVGPLDDLDGPFSNLGQGVTQFVAGIAAIGEDVPQPRIERTDRGQDIDRTVAILDVGGMDQQPDEITLGVGHDVSLAAFDLLAGVEASGTTAFGRFHRLTVDDAARRAGLAPTFSRSAMTSM